MANTYTQIYVQVVFAVEGRQNLIARERKEELQRYTRYDISSNMPPLRGSNFLLPIHSTNMALLRS